MLFAWAAKWGIESNDVNRIIADMRIPEPLRRLVIDLRDNRLPEEEFPKTATAQIYEDGWPKGDRVEAEIRPLNLVGAANAIASLVKAKQRAKFHVVDVIVPDLLILLDPSAILVQPRPRQVVELGSAFPVWIRLGGRLLDPDLQRLGLTYRALVRDHRRVRWVDEFPVRGALTDELTNSPVAVVFQRPMATQTPPDALLDAIYASPIVIWPATELEEPARLATLLEEHWSTLPTAVARARWRRASSRVEDDVRHLRQLRMVWEDDQWIVLAQNMESYG